VSATVKNVRSCDGTAIVDRIPVMGHLMIEVEMGVFACERCGLHVIVPLDKNPVANVFDACHYLSMLGRGCV
jgi:hypothetical protein